MQLPLAGGAYSARSIIANAQRCINYFPELNRKDSPYPMTHYQRPGLRRLVQGAAAAVRCLYRASNGNGYCVIGTQVYSISGNWVLTLLGVLTIATPVPVRMADNGTTILLVDGSVFGYTISLATNAFALLVDPTGTFNGANTVDFLDTFILWNLLGTRQFGSSLSGSMTFDGLYTASKISYPDPLSGLIVNRRELLLIGQSKSEIWYDAGGASFPFAELPGAYVEHGCTSPYSIAAEDINVYWLGRDLQGQGVVFRQRGYETAAISNHALSYAMRRAVAAGATLSDAIGYTYQQDGHVFYVLVLPSADMTWVYDSSVQEPDLAWHQRCWTDPADQMLHRDRTNCAAFINDTNVVGDWQNGSLYALDLNRYTDQVAAGDPGPISFIRGFPHVIGAADPRTGQATFGDGKRIQFNRVVADIECGNGPLDATGAAAPITLSYSDDRGKTFTSAPLQSSGAPGEWLTSPIWLGMGIARDRVFEISHSIAGPAALNGLWVDGQILGT